MTLAKLLGHSFGLRCAAGLSVTLGCLSALAAEPPRLLPGVEKQAAPPRVSAPARQAEGEATARSELEVISERYPNGAVRVRREVTQDEYENFVNHGGYELYDQAGKLVMSGRYNMGRMVGVWSRTLAINEINLGNDAVDRQFHGPFVSTVEFVDGEINGPWTIVDPSNHKVLEWQFRLGKPHGAWVWYHSNGRKRKQAQYEDGIIKGIVTEWTPDGKVAAESEYVDGRRRAPKTTYYNGGKQKKSEGVYLMSRDNSLITYDWLGTKVNVEPLGKAGPDTKDGMWTHWHANGQVQMTGEYRDGTPVGMFTWWFENGQKKAEGEYVDGQQHGRWTTWFANGLKQSQGEYEHGTPAGKWRTWNAEGRVAEAQEFHPGSEDTIISRETLNGKQAAPERLQGEQAPSTTKLPVTNRRARTPSTQK